MNRENEQFMEGFMNGLTCAGVSCDYKRDSAAWNNWWKGFKRAKSLGAAGANRVMAQLWKEYGQ